MQTLGPLPRLKFWICSGCVSSQSQQSSEGLPSCQWLWPICCEQCCLWRCLFFCSHTCPCICCCCCSCSLSLSFSCSLSCSLYLSCSCCCSIPFSCLFPYWRHLALSKPSWNSVLHHTTVPNQVFLTHRLNQISRTVVVCNFHHPWRTNGFASGIKWHQVTSTPTLNHPCSSLVDWGKHIITGGAAGQACMFSILQRQAMGITMLAGVRMCSGGQTESSGPPSGSSQRTTKLLPWSCQCQGCKIWDSNEPATIVFGVFLTKHLQVLHNGRVVPLVVVFKQRHHQVSWSKKILSSEKEINCKQFHTSSWIHGLFSLPGL